MALPKAALLRAVSDDIPLALIENIGATYISPDDIAVVARGAIIGDAESESSSFGGITRYLFVGENRAFMDPSGELLYNVRGQLRELRRTRGADPVAMKAKTRTMAQKQAAKAQPTGAG